MSFTKKNKKHYPVPISLATKLAICKRLAGRMSDKDDCQGGNLRLPAMPDFSEPRAINWSFGTHEAFFQMSGKMLGRSTTPPPRPKDGAGLSDIKQSLGALRILCEWRRNRILSKNLV